MRNDGLNRLSIVRGMAALLIVMTHYSMAWTEGIIKNIGGGLTFCNYVFFILSGFSIAYFHSEEHEKNGMNNMIRFFAKRFVRIFPLYWICTLGYLFCDLILGGVLLGHHDKSLINIIRSFLLFPSGILESYPSTLIPPAWFLSYVVFFYIIYGIARYIFGEKTFTIISRGWLFISLFSEIVRQAIVDQKIIETGMGGGISCVIEFLFSQHFVAIMMGVEIAFVVRSTHTRNSIVGMNSLRNASIIIFALFYAVMVKNYSLKYNSIFAIVGFILPISLFLLWFICRSITIPPNKQVGRIGEFLLLCDKASYSLYLIHYFFVIIIMIISGKVGNYYVPLMVVGYPIIVAICLGFYWIIQRRIDKATSKLFAHFQET